MGIGLVILYGTKGVIRVKAGKEAADEFDKHIVQVSIPHLMVVSDYIAHGAGLVGGVAGGILTPL